MRERRRCGAVRIVAGVGTASQKRTDGSVKRTELCCAAVTQAAAHWACTKVQTCRIVILTAHIVNVWLQKEKGATKAVTA